MWYDLIWFYTKVCRVNLKSLMTPNYQDMHKLLPDVSTYLHGFSWDIDKRMLGTGQTYDTNYFLDRRNDQSRRRRGGDFFTHCVILSSPCLRFNSSICSLSFLQPDVSNNDYSPARRTTASYWWETWNYHRTRWSIWHCYQPSWQEARPGLRWNEKCPRLQSRHRP